jgi:hypothetical protein
MALIIKTEIIINANPKKIWGILTDFKQYPYWNPFIKSIIGNVVVGEKISVIIEAPKTKSMTFKPEILTFVDSKELSWLGHLLFPGIFDGRHKFELITNTNGTTTFIQSEEFRGLLVPLFKKQLNENTKKGFIKMNKALKKMAERF